MGQGPVATAAAGRPSDRHGIADRIVELGALVDQLRAVNNAAEDSPSTRMFFASVSASIKACAEEIAAIIEDDDGPQ